MQTQKGKIFKPKSCLECVAVKIDREFITCLCYKALKAKRGSVYELKDMWKKCPIGWDKEET